MLYAFIIWTIVDPTNAKLILTEFSDFASVVLSNSRSCDLRDTDLNDNKLTKKKKSKRKE